MRILPVQPAYQPKHQKFRRAQMSVRYDKHTVTDSETGEKFELDPQQAWTKFNELNGVFA